MKDAPAALKLPSNMLLSLIVQVGSGQPDDTELSLKYSVNNIVFDGFDGSYG